MEAPNTQALPAADGASGYMPDLKSPGMIIALVFLGVIIIGVIVYLVIKFSMGMKYYSVISSPRDLSKLTARVEVCKTDVLPKLTNGINYTYAFWMYLNSVEQTAIPKMVFQRGNAQANPIVFVDTSSNTLTISLRTAVADALGAVIDPKTDFTINLPASSANGVTTPSSTLALQNETCVYSQVVIDYVPLQQWMHVAVAVSGQYAVVYKDGDIYKVINLTSSSCSGQLPKVRSFSTTEGSMYIGPAVAGSPPVNGAISKLLVFNYSITLQDAKDLYNARPVDTGVFSYMNLPFGVRSPIYSLTDQTATK